MASWVDPEQVKRSKACVNRVVKEETASWLKGEVKMHCARCLAEICREDRACRSCMAHLRRECPDCHRWVEMDVTFCPSCRHAFPLPAPDKATIKMWHDESSESLEISVIGLTRPGPTTSCEE